MKKIIKFLRFFYQNNIFKIIVIDFLFLLLITSRDLINVYIYKPIFDAYNTQNIKQVIAVCGVLFIVVAIYYLLQLFNNVYADSYNKNNAVDGFVRVFDIYHNLPFREINERFTNGDLFIRLNDKCFQLTQALTTIVKMIAAIIIFIVFCATCTLLSTKLLFLILIAITIDFLLAKIKYKINTDYNKQVSNIQGNGYSIKNDIFRNTEYHLINDSFKDIYHRYTSLREQSYKLEFKIMIINLIINFIDMAVSAALKVSTCLILVFEGIHDPGSIIISFNVIGQIRTLVIQIRNSITNFPSILLAIDMVNEIIFFPKRKDNKEKKYNSNYLINLKDVNFSYDKSGNSPQLNNINLKIPFNQKVAIIGKNGSGKSTLLKIIGGHIMADNGECFIDGKNSATLCYKDKRKLLSYIPANMLFFWDSVLSNVKMSADEGEELKSESLISKLELDAEKNKPIYDISKGQQQRVGVARGMLHNSKIIIADEPTASLDTELSKKVMELLKEQQKTVIVTTHNVQLLPYFERIIMLENGSIVFDGDYLSLLESVKFSELKGYEEYVS